MNNVNLGSIQIPINAATKTFAILAKRGAGKTYTGAVMAEEFAKNNIPFVVFDPIDVWWGLRLNKNGKDKGLPVVVFGTQHADIEIDRDMGRKIAQAVVRENVSVIISTMGIPGGKTAERHLIAEFAEELLTINNSPRHIFIEEAHEYVPQRVFGGLGKTFNAVSNLVVMGRNRRLGVTLINQRAATINKDVLTQLDTLLAFQNTSPQDRKALADWVEFHSAEGDFEKFMHSLPSLPKGEGWIWSPEFLNVFEKIKIRKRETFHPDADSVTGDFVLPELDTIDIQGFISKFSDSIKKEKKDKKSSERVAAEDMITEVEKLTITSMRNDYESQLLQKDLEIRKRDEIISNIRRLVGGGETGVTTNLSVNSSNIEMWIEKVGSTKAEGKILKFLSEKSGLSFTRGQLCLAVGISQGHLSNIFGILKGNRLVLEEGGKIKINPEL